jgi:hypothetical protein
MLGHKKPRLILLTLVTAAGKEIDVLVPKEA